MNIYESDRLLNEYLLFHYGSAEEILPYQFGPAEALHFPVRSVTETFDVGRIPANGRALDIGCAVGRASFELARHCSEVVGIDYSQRFIDACVALKENGNMPFSRLEEGARSTPGFASVPPEIERTRCRFFQGDAMDLPESLGQFDAVLAANLLCRLPDPTKFLDRLPSLVRPGGQLAITTPCTWMEEFTPRDAWLCSSRCSTWEALQEKLSGAFWLDRVFDLPMVIREHARKFQWTVTQASVWTRRED